MTTGITVKTGNFSCFKARAIKKVIHHPFFDLCYSSVFLSLKLNLNLVPCERGLRYHGESKMNSIGLISHGIKMLMPFLDRISIRLLVCFAVVGGVSLLSAFVALIYPQIFPFEVTRAFKIILLSAFIISSLSAMNMMVLFSIFSQSMRDAYKFVDLRSITIESKETFKSVS
jgi:hypothetical protein